MSGQVLTHLPFFLWSERVARGFSSVLAAAQPAIVFEDCSALGSSVLCLNRISSTVAALFITSSSVVAARLASWTGRPPKGSAYTTRNSALFCDGSSFPGFPSVRSYISRIAGIYPATARRIRRAAIASAKVAPGGSPNSLTNSAGICDVRSFRNSSVSTLVEGRPAGFPLRRTRIERGASPPRWQDWLARISDFSDCNYHLT